MVSFVILGFFQFLSNFNYTANFLNLGRKRNNAHLVTTRWVFYTLWPSKKSQTKLPGGGSPPLYPGLILEKLEKLKNAGGWFYHWPQENKLTKKRIALINSDICWLSNDIEITFKFWVLRSPGGPSLTQ